MNAGLCWFCGGPAGRGDFLDVSLRKDVSQTFVVVGVYERWKQTSVFVPRCSRCRIGHSISRVVRYILLGSLGINALMLVAWGASRASGDAWRDEWQLIFPLLWLVGWVLVWWGLREHRFSWHRLAPQPEKYAHEHPAVEKLHEEGWG